MITTASSSPAPATSSANSAAPPCPQTENIRISYINEVPAGSSTVHFRLNVPAEQYEKGPISLQSFKATGFPGKNLPGQVRPGRQ